jgi:hypothetical protein
VTFKDQAAADLSTFLNVEEFADTVDIDGDAVACVFEGNGDTRGSGEGVTERDTVVWCRASDFHALPKVDQRITIDGDQADVIEAYEDQGIFYMRLRWLDS